MSQRIEKINILIMQEISRILHTDFRDHAVNITLIEVRISPDFHQANVYYSVIGGPEKEKEAARFLSAKKTIMRKQVAKAVKLRNSPDLIFLHDRAIERGMRVIEILDNLPDAES